MIPVGWLRQLTLLIAAFLVTWAVASVTSGFSAGMTAGQVVFVTTLVVVIVSGSR